MENILLYYDEDNDIRIDSINEQLVKHGLKIIEVTSASTDRGLQEFKIIEND